MLEHAENLLISKNAALRSKRKSPVAKGEQANRAKKEKVLNGHFQFKQFFSSGQQVVKKKFSLTRTPYNEKASF